MNRELTRAILSLSPDADFSLPGDDLSSLQWMSGERPDDAAVLAEQSRLAVLAEQKPYQEAVSAFLNRAATARGYDGILAAVSYSTSDVPAWKAEGLAFRKWRDAVWAYATAELAKVQTGQRQKPAVGVFIEELPEFGA